MTAALRPTTREPAYRWGGLALLLATAAILAALGFEYIGGYSPCPLCLEQRTAYYVGIPLAFLGLVLLAAGRDGVAALAFLLLALGFLYNAGLGVYHAGAEWKFWQGPQSCGGTLAPLSSGSGSGVLAELGRTRVLRCDEAPWRFAGLSFAGWNVVISVILLFAGLQAAFAARARRS
jgi:disulfide bond formation protein DsbB